MEEDRTDVSGDPKEAETESGLVTATEAVLENSAKVTF